MNMIFDSNVWFTLARLKPPNQNLPQVLDQIDIVLSTLNVQVYYTAINLWEAILGLNDSNFKAEQEKLRKVRNISKGRFLAIPEEFVQADFDRNFSRLNLSCDNYWIGLPDRIIEASSYCEIQEELNSCKTDIRDFRDEWAKFIDDSNQTIRKILKDRYGASTPEEITRIYLSGEYRQHLWHSYLENFIKRFKIQPKWTCVTFHHAFELLGTFRVFAATYQAYNLRLLRRDPRWGKADKGDYFDIEQLLYLAEIDYFVTEEKKLHSLYEAIPNSPLAHRVIGLKDLIERLDRDNLQEA